MLESCDSCGNGFKPSDLIMKYPEGDQLCYCPNCFPKQKDSGVPDFFLEKHTVEIEPRKAQVNKGLFMMRGYTPELINTYNCNDCSGYSHEVIHVPTSFTNRISHCGPSFSTTIRQCTRCKRWDGPWVSADLFY